MPEKRFTTRKLSKQGNKIQKKNRIDFDYRYTNRTTLENGNLKKVTCTIKSKQYPEYSVKFNIRGDEACCGVIRVGDFQLIYPPSEKDYAEQSSEFLAKLINNSMKGEDVGLSYCTVSEDYRHGRGSGSLYNPLIKALKKTGHKTVATFRNGERLGSKIQMLVLSSTVNGTMPKVFDLVEDNYEISRNEDWDDNIPPEDDFF